MAQFKINTNWQQQTFNIPDEGEIFRTPQDPTALHKRVGNTIYTLNPEQVKQAGIDINKYQPKYNSSDILTVFNTPGFSYQSEGADPNIFKVQGQTISDIFEQTNSPNNPFGMNITNITTGQPIYRETAYQQGAINTGGTIYSPSGQVLQQGGTISVPSIQKPGAGMSKTEVQALQDFFVKQGLMTQAQVNTGYGIFGPQTTAAYNKWLQMGGQPNITTSQTGGVGGTPTINIGGLSGGASPLAIAPYTSSTVGADAVASGATSYLASLQQEIDRARAAEAPATAQVSNLRQQVNDLLAKNVSREALQAQADTEQGVAQKREALNAVNAQIQQKLAEYNALSVDVQGKPITMASIIGAQAQIKNVAGAEIGLLQAQASALQGQYETAVNQANRAVDLKYNDQVNQLNMKLKQLELISDELDDKQKITANLLTQKYNYQKQILDFQIDTEKQLNVAKLDLIKKYGVGSINDSMETLQTKTRSSPIYQKEVKEGSEKSLSILDIGRYQELYPEAGIIAGDTEKQANAKITAINTPEAKTRSLIVAAKTNGNSYETVINEIKNDTTIKDKETATKIANEVYGKTSEVITPVYGRNNFSNTEINTRIEQLRGFEFNEQQIKAQLKEDGYPLTEINKKTGSWLDKLTSWIFGE